MASTPPLPGPPKSDLLMGQNQWSSFPTLPGANTASPVSGGVPTNTAVKAGGFPMPTPPGVVPSAPPTGGGAGGSFFTGPPQGTGNAGAQVPRAADYLLGKGQYEVPPVDPSLTGNFFNWLQSQIGGGATPFNLSAVLPTGGTTTPGSLTPGLDPLSAALQSFYQTGTSTNPGLQSLSQMAQTGDPISALPEWNAMVEAMQQQINTGAANVREQEGATGNLPGSGGALATSLYQNQATKDLNAQLVGAQTTALEAAQQRKLGASGLIQQGEQQMAPYLQGLDQTAIQNMYQEFIRTRPEYNPLNQMEFSGATSFPPTYGKAPSPGIIGSVLSAAPALAGGAAAGLGAAGGGAGIVSSILAGLAAL